MRLLYLHSQIHGGRQTLIERFLLIPVSGTSMAGAQR